MTVNQRITMIYFDLINYATLHMVTNCRIPAPAKSILKQVLKLMEDVTADIEFTPTDKRFINEKGKKMANAIRGRQLGNKDALCCFMAVMDFLGKRLNRIGHYKLAALCGEIEEKLMKAYGLFDRNLSDHKSMDLGEALFDRLQMALL